MTESLDKPDEAHKRQMFAESRARIAMQAFWIFYIAAAVITFAFQLSVRLNSCTEAFSCGLQAGKALVWCFFWPFYWMFYTNGLS
jgi:hypothetical protein